MYAHPRLVRCPKCGEREFERFVGRGGCPNCCERDAEETSERGDTISPDEP